MPVIEQREVTIYAKRQAAINKSTAKNKKLSEQFKKSLLEGNPLPSEGPYVIELAQNGGKDLDWQDQFKALYTEINAKKYGVAQASLLAEKRVAEIEALAPPKPAVEVLGKEYVGGFKLTVKVNPSYRTQRKVA